MRHILFFGLMAFASAISVLKMAVLAALFSPSDFTHYAAAFALVGITASAVSFGMTDGLVKRFVRLFEFGRINELRAGLKADNLTLLRRHVFALAVGTVGAWVVIGPSSIVPAMAIVFLAYATNLFSIVSSLFHGLHRLLGLALSSLARATLALLFVTIVGLFFGWRSGLLAEAAASILVGLIFLLHLRRAIRSNSQPVLVNTSGYVSDEKDGYWLFLASMAALIPVSFDRIWVSHFAPGPLAAQYAFAMIWVAAAFTVTSIYIQKFGPDAVRASASSEGMRLLPSALLHSSVIAGLLAAGSVVSLAAIYLLFFDVYWQKYGLSGSFVVPTTIVAALQVNRIFDWALIALDGERYVLAAASIFAVVAIVAFCACAYLGLGFVGYMTSLAIAKFLQILTMVLCIARLEATRGGQR